jgi:hypothetical protein
MENISKKKLVIGIIVLVLFIVAIVAAVIFGLHKAATQNQFGGYIKIQNYDQKIKNVSSDVKDALQTSLYSTVKRNSPDSFDPTTVKDAFIRDGSDTQNFDSDTKVYSGTFIVDMANIKQSYKAQYSYSVSNTIDTGGSPVIFSCLAKDQLKYGEFDCKDLAAVQASPNEDILQYLPYENFSYKISPDATTGGKLLVLNVVLTIPDIDLTGDAASRAQIVALYKKQVTDWITSKGLEPANYSIQYNYTDAGVYLGESNFSLN